jgi:N-acetylmuramoyl-L-alanine amidase
MVRVVLEVDDVSDYSAFLLPNPYRLIVDIHGRKPNAPQTLVARAQRAEEKHSPSPEETKPETPAPAAASAIDVAPVTPEVVQAKPADSASPATKPASEFGPRMEDGKFYSYTSPKVADTNKSVVSAPPLAHVDFPRMIEPPSASDVSQESTKPEVANLKPELKATEKPTSKPTVQVVAPRDSDNTKIASAEKNPRYPEIHQAEPTADGGRSLIRALGLKVGRIVIDAGHGGHDTGTIGPNGLLEKDLVLDVSLRLGRLLKNKMGADVVYTREDDTFVPLETRTAIANQHQADLFISLHANSSQDPAVRGVETYYLNFNSSRDAMEVAARENAVSEKSVHELGDLVKKIALKDKVEESREFAADVQHSLYQGLAGKGNAINDRGVKKAMFIVLIGANMPSILAEISFVSNPSDARKLQTPEYRQKIAESLYRGVARYVNGLSGVKVASKGGGGEGEP